MAPRNIHFIPHVHWDREWLRSSDSSRIKLVYFFDRLLSLFEKDPDMKYFTFDGQTAGLEDYLAIKPWKKDAIQKLVEQRKLFIGPWYVQPDMIMPAGESLFRNLLLGYEYASSLGHCMQVGWVPDAFGQNRNTPYLFKEMGMQGIFAWRGFDYNMLPDSLFTWKSNGGVTLPTVHFALGYGHYRGFPESYEEVKKDMKHFIPQLEKRYKDGEVLFMLGSDYAFPRANCTRHIAAMQQDGYTCLMDNPEDYLQSILEANKKQRHPLYTFEGEARSASLGRIHAGITSTRIDIKNTMRKYETMLAKVVEPMLGISRFVGGHCEQEVVNYFWKILFKNQFHDSIYSSSPDTINKTVENRLLNLRHGLQELIWINFRYIAQAVDLHTVGPKEDILVLYNTLPYIRHDYAFISMIVKEENFILQRHDGTVVPYQRMQQCYPTNHDIEYYNGMQNLHDAGLVLDGIKHKIQIKIDASLLPPMGYEVLKITYQKQCPIEVSADVECLTNGAQNTYLKMEIQSDGTLSVCHRQTGEIYHELNTFIDTGDDGDEYNYSPCIDDTSIRINDSLPTITCIEKSSIQVTYRIQYKVMLPERVEKHRRVKERKPMTIISDVTLMANSKRLDFTTTIENHTKDHKVRVSFKDIHTSSKNESQDQFGSIIRDNILHKQLGLAGGATEHVLPIYAFLRYVLLCHNRSIMGLISRGPLEYEIEEDQRICLTLLRSVGKFGKADLVIRPGRSSGYQMETPSSQLLNTSITSEYALYFDKQGQHSQLVQEAEIYNTPVQSRHLNDILRSVNKGLDWSYSALTVDPRVEVMAFKRAENGEYAVLRIVNNRKTDVHDVVILIPKDKKCYSSDVREKKGKELIQNEGKVSIDCIVSSTCKTLRIE